MEIFGGTAGSVITGVLTWDPDSSDVWGQVVVPGSAGLVIVLSFALLVLIFNLFRAPVRQRNELRRQLLPVEEGSAVDLRIHVIHELAAPPDPEEPQKKCRVTEVAGQNREPDDDASAHEKKQGLLAREEEIEALLTKVSRRQVTLNECVADGLQVARRIENEDLERFCRQEMRGFPSGPGEPHGRPEYRLVPAFASTSEINPMYYEWGGKASPMFAHMRERPEEFVPQQLFVWQSVAVLETMPSDEAGTSYVRIQKIHGETYPDSKTPDAVYFLYHEANVYPDVIEAIRGELTEKILASLPEAPGN